MEIIFFPKPLNNLLICYANSKKNYYRKTNSYKTSQKLTKVGSLFTIRLLSCTIIYMSMNLPQVKLNTYSVARMKLA